MDFINPSNENESSYTTLKFWFFEIIKSYNNELVFIVCENGLLSSFVNIKQKSIINSSQLYLEI